MRAIGVNELKIHASEIMRQVREERVSYTITYRGKPVGVLLPLEESGDVSQEKDQDSWSKVDEIREKMSSLPRPEKSLTEALSEMRFSAQIRTSSFSSIPLTQCKNSHLNQEETPRSNSVMSQYSSEDFCGEPK